jgi:hypothetical protein
MDFQNQPDGSNIQEPDDEIVTEDKIETIIENAQIDAQLISVLFGVERRTVESSEVGNPVKANAVGGQQGGGNGGGGDAFFDLGGSTNTNTNTNTTAINNNNNNVSSSIGGGFSGGMSGNNNNVSNSIGGGFGGGMSGNNNHNSNNNNVSNSIGGGFSGGMSGNNSHNSNNNNSNSMGGNFSGVNNNNASKNTMGGGFSGGMSTNFSGNPMNPPPNNNDPYGALDGLDSLTSGPQNPDNTIKNNNLFGGMNMKNKQNNDMGFSTTNNQNSGLDLNLGMGSKPSFNPRVAQKKPQMGPDYQPTTAHGQHQSQFDG